ncbi:MAG TPA: hypothetical protein PKE12_10975 [Kiritimatiellia bacterium]|nr:hypothetical protein [Kiritimatiellia bacterium]
MPAPLTYRRLLWVWIAAALVFGAAWWWRLHRDPPLDAGLSPIARRLVNAVRAPLHLVRGGYAHVYALDPHEAAGLLEEAEYAVAEISRRLGVAVPGRPVRILLLPHHQGWDELTREKGFRPDSLAFNLRDEIFLKDDPEQAARPDRLAHEIVHFVLRESHGDAVPLWLDEGLAGRLGFVVSRAYRASRGRRIAGAWPSLPADAMPPLEVLTSRHVLPDDPREARIFYRASEELVALIEDRIGASKMPEFIADVAAGTDWRVAMDARLNGSAYSSVDMEQAVRRQLAAPRRL